MLTPQNCNSNIFDIMTAGSPARGARRLPDWGVFFIDLGAFAGNVQEDSSPFTVALSVPTRTFAAVLTALGVVHQRCALTPEGQEHFKDLWQGELGVTVRFRQGNLELRGSLEDKEVRGGIRYLVIASSKTGLCRVPETMANSIISIKTTHKRPQRVRKLTVEDPWLAQMLQGCDSSNYLFYNRHDCLLVGYDSGLKEEAALPLHISDNSNRLLSGHVADLLRVRSWQALSKTYSTEVLSHATSEENANFKLLRQFRVVVFDGAGPYMRWYRRFEKQHHIVLLDRTEAKFSEGTSAVNSAALDRSGDFVSLPLVIPSGIEAVAFRRHL